MLVALALVAVQSSTDPMVAIDALHRAFNRAIVAKNGTAMRTLTMEAMLPEFVWTRADGRKQTLTGMWDTAMDDENAAKAGKGDGPLRYETRLSNLRRKGDRLIVDATSDVVGEWLQNGRRLPVEFRSLARETWVLREGRWKALRFDDVWIRGKIDGKPFVAKAR